MGKSQGQGREDRSCHLNRFETNQMCPKPKHIHQSLSQHLVSEFLFGSLCSPLENKDGAGEVLGETEALVSERTLF